MSCPILAEMKLSEAENFHRFLRMNTETFTVNLFSVIVFRVFNDVPTLRKISSKARRNVKSPINISIFHVFIYVNTQETIKLIGACKRHVRRFLSNIIAVIRIKSNQTDLIRIFLQVECDFFTLLMEYCIGCYTQK